LAEVNARKEKDEKFAKKATKKGDGKLKFTFYKKLLDGVNDRHALKK